MDNIQKPDWKKNQPSLEQWHKYKGRSGTCQPDVWYNIQNLEGGYFENILVKCFEAGIAITFSPFCSLSVLSSGLRRQLSK